MSPLLERPKLCVLLIQTQTNDIGKLLVSFFTDLILIATKEFEGIPALCTSVQQKERFNLYTIIGAISRLK